MHDDITVKGLLYEVIIMAASIGILDISLRYIVYKMFEIVLQLPN